MTSLDVLLFRHNVCEVYLVIAYTTSTSLSDEVCKRYQINLCW